MSTVGDAIFKWSWWIMGYEIGFSIVIGFVVGFIARRVLRYSEERYVILYENTQINNTNIYCDHHLLENGSIKSHFWFMQLH